MATRRRYTAKQRAEAAGIAVVEGATRAAEDTGIPRKTIEYWLDRPEFAELRLKTRDQVADQMWAAIQIGLREVAKGLEGEAPLRDKSVTLGILYDKHALLTGMATSRSESRDLTGTMSDAELIAAVAEADEITGEERDPVAREGAPAG